MHKKFLPFLMICSLCLMGCSSYQPTKNAWKSTKSFWNTYFNQPAKVDYDEKGNLSPQALELSNSMIGIDVEFTKFERAMMNADKPPTKEWVQTFFNSFPWIGGFAGVKNDGTILGQEPETPLKELDFIPLLYEDKKQNSRALRGDVQYTPLGPEVLVATPLYDSTEFKGVVVAHFDMRSLMQYSSSPENIVILTPQALLWPGKYDFASTPLAGVNWDEVVAKNSSGTCSNANGSFYFMIRYLGNIPLVFAVAEKGNFAEGNGELEQGLAFFPKEREKLPPPPLPEKKKKSGGDSTPVDLPSLENTGDTASPQEGGTEQGQKGPSNEIQPGSKDSLLLKQQRRAPRNVEERHLEGENVPVERETRRKTPAKPKQSEKKEPVLELMPEEHEIPRLSGGRPSPFGDSSDKGSSNEQEKASESANEKEKTPEAPVEQSPEKSSSDSSTNSTSTPNEPAVNTLPGGRPSPFGSSE